MSFYLSILHILGDLALFGIVHIVFIVVFFAI
jgi:hypothetical protein